MLLPQDLTKRSFRKKPSWCVADLVLVCSLKLVRFTAQRKFQGKWQPKLEGFDVALGRRFSQNAKPVTPCQARPFASPTSPHSHTSHTVTPPHRHIFLLQERACRERI